MKRIMIVISVMLVSLPGMAAEPSAMFGQELAQVSKPNAINIDFATQGTYAIRVGASNGEIIATYGGSPYGGSDYLAYKWFVGNSFAIYAGLGMNNGTNDVLLIGGAYTLDSNNIRFNINPVINLAGATSQTDVYAGAYMKLKGGNTRGQMLVGAQFHMDVTGNTSDVIGGIRWTPRSNLTIDLGLVDTGAPGGGGLNFPGVFTINMSF